MHRRNNPSYVQVRRVQWRLAALLLLAVSLLLAACGPAAAPPPPTRAPAPTFTPTPEGQPPQQVAAPVNAQPSTDQQQPTGGDSQPAGEGQQPAGEAAEQPTNTPESVPTDTPAPASVVINIQLMNIRGGPGINYNIVGSAAQNERFPVTGKNADGTWWQIDYNGQAGWVFGELVRAENTQEVALAQNIPAPPPPTNTPPPPPPTNTPVPAAPAPAPSQDDNLPYGLIENSARCDPNAGQTYFNGFVRYKNNSPRNAVCVHIAFYGPRTTKCSGCDGVGDGNWGFSPFGGPAPPGTPVEIFVVGCPGTIPAGGLNSGFGDLTPLSPKWTRTIQASEQCTGITFYSKNE